MILTIFSSLIILSCTLLFVYMFAKLICLRMNLVIYRTRQAQIRILNQDEKEGIILRIT